MLFVRMEFEINLATVQSKKVKVAIVLLTPIGMRQGTFTPLSFLDWILSAEFLSKFQNSSPGGTKGEHFFAFIAHANEG